MLPPAVACGVFEFTAFCSLTAAPTAACEVSAFWTPSWKPPGPPQPATQSVRVACDLQPQPVLVPTSWRSDWCWSVFAAFETSAFAVDVAVWLAVLGPEETFPPAIATGALPFTAF